MREALFVSLGLLFLFGCGQEERGILFSSTRDGIQDVYVMDPDGSNVRRLTYTVGGLGTSHTSLATWSPSGDLIAFASDGIFEGQSREFPGSNDVFLMNPDGSGIRQLTFDPAADGEPDFAPDGKRIAFVSNRDGNPEIYTISLDNNEEPRRLTDWEGWDEFPDWHPDGSKILFESEGRDGFDGLFIMDSDGGNVRHLVDGSRGKWSPDGSKVAFMARDCYVGSKQTGFDEQPLPVSQVERRCRTEGVETGGIFVLDMINGGLSRVFPSESGSGELTSPDGRSHSTVELAVEPVWSPAGDKLLFHSGRLGPDTEPFWDVCCTTLEIFMVNLDGSDLRALTWNLNFDGHMRWY